MKIKPLFGRVIVKAVEEEEMSNSLITIPVAGMRDRGRVLFANGDGEVQVGDLVMFNLRAARIIKINQEEFISLEEKDILVIFKE